MKVPLRRVGNSRGVIIPKPLISQLNFGDSVEMSVEDDALVLRRPKRQVRRGWVEAARKMAEAGRAGMVWPEFSNAGDKDLKW